MTQKLQRDMTLKNFQKEEFFQNKQHLLKNDIGIWTVIAKGQVPRDRADALSNFWPKNQISGGFMCSWQNLD